MRASTIAGGLDLYRGLNAEQTLEAVVFEYVLVESSSTPWSAFDRLLDCSVLLFW